MGPVSLVFHGVSPRGEGAPFHTCSTPQCAGAGQGPTSHPRAQEFHPNQLCNAFQVLLVSEVTDLAALFSLVEKEQGGQLKQW